MSKTYTFHVAGMHCNACVLMTESELRDVPGVTAARSNLETRTVEVTGDFGNKEAAEIAAALTEVLSKHGYALSVDRPAPKKDWGEFAYALPLATIFILGFIALQKAGLVNLVSGGEVTYGTAFVIGLIASLSTCLAIVGGLVLSMSATFAKEGDGTRPQLLFHAGRLVSFFVLGGVIGSVGSVFRPSGAAALVLGIVVGVVMLILGLNLLDVFDWAKRLQPSMPRFLSSRAMGVSRHDHVYTPLAVGVATFFLPCGFTQSMQLYTLTAGGFLRGGLTMLAFALGTLPVLALLSFGPAGAAKGPRRGIFFKAAGIVVILFALYGLLGAVVAAGLLPPLFTF